MNTKSNPQVLEKQALESAKRSLLAVLNEWEQGHNKMFQETYPDLLDECFEAIDSKSSHKILNKVKQIERIIGGAK